MKKSFVSVGNKFGPLIILIMLPLLVLMPLFLTHQMHYKIDVWFHIMRIQEMNAAIHEGVFPGLGNMHSFGDAGQLIQGMYPSLTLGIFVWITYGLTAINQIYAIYYLILLSISLTYFFVFKKISQTKWHALIKAIVMSYPTTYYFMVFAGQFGLTLASVFLPFVFWGLYKIRDKNYKYAYLYIGLGTGLIFNSHMVSALCTVIIVIVVAVCDLMFEERNFFEYVKAGLVAMVIGLPTLMKIIMFNGSVLGVVSVNSEANLNVLTMFEPLWTKGAPYFGFTSVMLIGFIFILLTIFKDTTSKSLKIAVLIMALMSTTTGYLMIFESIQYSYRFMTYALQLGMFVFLIELPGYHNKLGVKNTKMIYFLLVFVSIVPAVNSVLTIREFIKDKPVWQVSKRYDKERNVIDKNTFKNNGFFDMRTYVDYMPKAQKNNSVKGPKAYIASKEMGDVNEAKSVRLSGFKSKEIKMSKSNVMNDDRFNDNQVIPYQPAFNIKVNKRTIYMDVKVGESGIYDLPFWMYPHIPYEVEVDSKKVNANISNQSRVSIPLSKGLHHIALTQKLPKSIVVAYVISVLSIVFSALTLFWFRREK